MSGRECGECGQCCKLIGVRELEKAPHVWCRYYKRGMGCGVYEGRPQGCADFACDWLLDDQRHAASRTDVLVYQTEPLDKPLRIAGEPIAHLFASTSGGDSDWVVKIIDVWPDEVPERPLLGGYQQMLSADIFRGRYRVDPAKPQALAPNKALPYRIALPHASHTFLPGHRIMVQIQSSWVPLYDRNPQTFVPNIMYAKPENYVKATQRIWHAPGGASAIELPVVRAN